MNNRRGIHHHRRARDVRRAPSVQSAPLLSGALFNLLRDRRVDGAISRCDHYVASWENEALVVGFPDEDYLEFDSSSIFATAFGETEWLVVPRGREVEA